jgi:hypothetical protein
MQIHLTFTELFEVEVVGNRLITRKMIPHNRFGRILSFIFF